MSMLMPPRRMSAVKGAYDPPDAADNSAEIARDEQLISQFLSAQDRIATIASKLESIATRLNAASKESSYLEDLCSDVQPMSEKEPGTLDSIDRAELLNIVMSVGTFVRTYSDLI